MRRASSALAVAPAASAPAAPIAAAAAGVTTSALAAMAAKPASILVRAFATQGSAQSQDLSAQSQTAGFHQLVVHAFVVVFVELGKKNAKCWIGGWGRPQN